VLLFLLCVADVRLKFVANVLEHHKLVEDVELGMGYYHSVIDNQQQHRRDMKMY